MKFALCETTLGWAAIGIEDGAICSAALPTSRRAAEDAIASWDAEGPADEGEAGPFIDLVQRAANGERVEANGALRLVGGTAFQRAVWQEVRSIPYGATITYAELARRIGRPGAARAVGQAVGCNPIPLLIPCHRVLASDGIGGFGGGLPLKRALLSNEGVSA